MVPTVVQLSTITDSPGAPQTPIKVIRDKERELHFTKYPFCLIPGNNHYEPVQPDQSKLALICAGPTGFLRSWNSSGIHHRTAAIRKQQLSASASCHNSISQKHSALFETQNLTPRFKTQWHNLFVSINNRQEHVCFSLSNAQVKPQRQCCCGVNGPPEAGILLWPWLTVGEWHRPKAVCLAEDLFEIPPKNCLWDLR